MPKFIVSVSQTITNTADIIIEAPDDDTAQERVMSLLNDYEKQSQLGHIDWQLEDEEFDCLDVSEG
jgi:hypothetical protein